MYQILPYTRQQARRLGVTVKPSHLPHKKLDVFEDGHLIASIGATGYPDYPHYLQSHGKAYADNRRRLYHLRHTHPTRNEKLAKQLLW